MADPLTDEDRAAAMLRLAVERDEARAALVRRIAGVGETVLACPGEHRVPVRLCGDPPTCPVCERDRLRAAAQPFAALIVHADAPEKGYLYHWMTHDTTTVAHQRTLAASVAGADAPTDAGVR